MVSRGSRSFSLSASVNRNGAFPFANLTMLLNTDKRETFQGLHSIRNSQRGKVHTWRILQRGEPQAVSSQGWNMPSVTQFRRITSMLSLSNQVHRSSVKETNSPFRAEAGKDLGGLNPSFSPAGIKEAKAQTGNNNEIQLFSEICHLCTPMSFIKEVTILTPIL